MKGTNVCIRRGQSLKYKEKKLKLTTLGFTLVELLAVIVILAIIAFIATPIILNTINDTKKQAAKISVQNYIKAVELAIAKEHANNSAIKLDGNYKIIDSGSEIRYITEEGNESDSIKVQFEGQEVIVDDSSFVIIEQGKVRKIKNTKVDKWYVYMVEGELNLFDTFPESNIVSGPTFNSKIKCLANNVESFNAWSNDEKITSIEFLSFGKLPEEYNTLSELQNLPSVDLTDSVSKGQPIIVYYDSKDGKIYVYSESMILFNTNATVMFGAFTKLENIEFGKIDTSQVTDMTQMFSGSSSLTNLNLTSFDTGKVTRMFGMFQGCSSLTELNLSSFDTKNVGNMQQMFYGCSSLTELDVSSFDTSNVKNMSNMFAHCTGITNLDLTNFNTISVQNMEYMFYSNRNFKLVLVDKDKWITSGANTASMFYNSGVSQVTYK